MKNKKYPLVVFAIISLAIILVSAIIVAIFSVNTSIEIGGGSQIEVVLSYDQGETHYEGKENVESYVKKIEDVLHNHKANVDSYFVEDKNIDTVLVVRIAKKSISGADSIQTEVASALDLDVSRVSKLQTLSSYFSNRLVLFVGLAILAALAICFFMGWLRYGILAGVSLMFTLLHSFILSLAIVFLTRIQFSMVGLCCSLVLSILSTFAFALVLERYRENKKSSQYAEYSYDEHLLLATKQNKWLLIFAVVGVVLSFTFVLTPVAYVRLIGLNVLISLLVAAYSTTCIAPALHCYMLEIAGNKEKVRLSKNQPNKKKAK